MEPITIGIICIALAWGATVASDAIKKNKKENTKQLQAESQKEVELAKLKAAEEANKRIEEEKKTIREEKEKEVKEIKELKKQSEDARNNSQNPNLSEDERRSWVAKHRQFEAEIEEKDKKIKGFDSQFKDLNKQQEKNDKIIADVKSNIGGFNFDPTDYLNIETAVIVGGCFIIYKLLKDKD